MSDWIDSNEAAKVIGCTKANLYNIVAKYRHSHIIRRKQSRNETTAFLLYNRADCEAVAQKRAKLKTKADGTLQKSPGVEVSMWHPAMNKPWTREGLRGITL